MSLNRREHGWQIAHKHEIDEDCLFGYCRRRPHETEFFIRKAIGWVLRQYSYTASEKVIEFLRAEQHNLSRLSFREGAKGLRRHGYDT